MMPAISLMYRTHLINVISAEAAHKEISIFVVSSFVRSFQRNFQQRFVSRISVLVKFNLSRQIMLFHALQFRFTINCDFLLTATQFTKFFVALAQSSVLTHQASYFKRTCF